ncbi:hypothetical protein [Leptolyngbya ohadii]|uniref:hypothetical protein n=1 Tax=Leptolyngbya ohadii TaxID=1962290 RepID=UPI000B59B36E|nr:hypothetical protein [Leptolyngbya ohadii]
MSNAVVHKQQKLARKSAWGTGILTLFIPFAGYLYTARYRLAAITLVFWIPLIAADESNETASTMLGFLMLGTCIENTIAVVRAKGEAKEMMQQEQQQQSASTLQVELLKLAKQKGEVTVADCVLATQRGVDEVQATLSKLELSDLIRASNRASDGAVVYRIV